MISMKICHKRQQKAHKLALTKHLTCKEGLTLIEIIISLAIFGILMVLFSTLMGVAIQMRKNVFEQNRSSMKLIKELAEDHAIERKPTEMQFNFNGKTLTISGYLKTKEEDGVTYHVFEPKEYEVKQDE